MYRKIPNRINKTKIKKIALPSVTMAAIIPATISKNKIGFSLRSFFVGLGIVSYFILLTIRRERSKTKGIIISE